MRESFAAETVGIDLKARQWATFATVVLGILCIISAYAAERVALDNTIASARTHAIEDLNLLRTRLESSINADVQLIRGLVSYIESVPDIDQKTFARVAESLVDAQVSQFRNLALAKDLVVSHVYPFDGNEQVLGIDYRTLDDQWPQVERAIRNNEIVIAGPINLIQGGVGLIGRFPVYTFDREGHRGGLWGIVGTVVDFDRFLDSVEIETFSRAYSLQLVGRDGKGAAGEVFWRSTDVPPTAPVNLKIVLTSGHWVLEGAPIGGWPRHSPLLPGIIIVASIVFIAGLLAATFYARYESRLRQTNRELALARDEALRASLAKSDFLASMSHELRTPLNAIIGFSEMISGEILGKISAPVYKEYADHIQSSGTHLLRIINDVLDLSKVESGRSAPEFSTFTIEPIVRQAIKLVTGRSGVDHPVFHSSIVEDASTLHADPRYLSQILLNLLSNADKYTPASGSVTVSSQRESNGDILIRVTDNGQGIRERDLELVLEPFGQARQDAALAHEGTGLGLALASKMMKLMHGDLTIESTFGQGTTVTLHFTKQSVQ